MRTLKVIGLILILSGIGLLGQTVSQGPVNTSMRLAWENPSNSVLADAPTFEYRVRDSLSPTSFQVLSGVQCSGTTVVTCTAQLTQAIVDILNKLGSHGITLAVFRADLGESAQSLPFGLSSPAVAPTGVKIIR